MDTTYTQKEIEEILAKRIKEFEYEPDKKIPADRELMEEFNVSRSTIRTITEKLITRRLAYRVPGVGVFAETELVRESSRIVGFNELIKSNGKTPRTEIIDKKTMFADAVLARTMGIPIDTEVYYLEKKRYVDDQPLLFEQVYIPKKNVSGLLDMDLENRSLYAIYDEHEVDRKHLVQAVSAVTVDGVISDFLYGTSTGYALKVTGRTYGPNSSLVEFGIGFYHAENFSFESVLTNNEL